MPNAIVLKNQNEGTRGTSPLSAERPLTNGLWLKTAYSYGEAKNTVDPGSHRVRLLEQQPALGRSQQPWPRLLAAARPGTAFFAAASYTQEYFNFGGHDRVASSGRAARSATPATRSRGDLNGDGGTSNDLIYIPRDKSEMNFQTFAAGGVTFTRAEQAQAWDQYIERTPT